MHRSRVRRIALAGAALLAIAATAASCDTAERVRSKVVAINILLELGDPLDVAPRHTEIAANLMSISGPVDSPTATPLAGAGVSLNIEGVTPTIFLAEDTPGVYRAGSGTAGNPNLVYTSNAEYALTIDVPSGSHEGTYELAVTAPSRTNVNGLPDTANGQMVPAGQDLVVTLQGNYDQGLIVVVDSSGNVVFDNRPTDVQSAVDFVFGDFNGQLTIPGSAIANPGTAYGVVIAGLESAPSSDISSNLNILSRFYAGSAKTAIVVTQP